MDPLPPRHNPHFTVLDETEDYLVVNKPAPLQTHPANPSPIPTLWHGLRDLLAFELTLGGQISIINRLDRETSGVTLVAKNPATARRFGLAMERRQFHKTYLAWSHGWPQWNSQTCHGPLRRLGEFETSPIWVKQVVHPSGTPCTTNVRVLRRTTASFGPISLCEVHPLTGRMHQIRAHLSHLGFPIVGDKIYGLDDTCYLDLIASGWTPELLHRLHLPRHALHAWQLELRCPDLHAHWIAPIPTELAALATPPDGL